MGLLKSGAKKVFVTAPLKVALIPARVAMPRALKKSHNYYVETVRKARAYSCPSCGEGKLIAITKTDLPSSGQSNSTQSAPPPSLNQIWECSYCSERVETNSADLNELSDLLVESGRDRYEQGYAYQERAEATKDGRLLERVTKKVKVARILCVISILIATMFFYGVYKGRIMFIITILLFSLLLFMMAILNTYRAWQLYTDNVFVSDPKEQFHWWLYNEKWFAYPANYSTAFNAYSDRSQYDDSDEEFSETEHYSDDFSETEHYSDDLRAELSDHEVVADEFNSIVSKYINNKAIEENYIDNDAELTTPQYPNPPVTLDKIDN